MSSTARETALQVLVSCRTNGAWADAALKAQLSRDGLTGAEAALCSRIVYGVMQNQLLLDFYLQGIQMNFPEQVICCVFLLFHKILFRLQQVF